MTRLLHDPLGRHHPYEPDPGGRHPLHPMAGETVWVGAQGGPEAAPVHVEWQVGGSHQAGVAIHDGEAWRAEIGPFQPGQEVRYRFVDRGGSATPWFAFTTGWWETPSWEGVEERRGSLEATFGCGVLRLTPVPSGQLDWEVVLSPTRASLDRAELKGWKVRIEAGRLRLSSQGWLRLLAPPRLLRRSSGCEEVELAWELDPHEHILGTGERYDALDQRGRNPDVRVYDQYKGQGSRTYFPVPFFLSSSGYGFLVRTGARVRFDFGHLTPDVLRIRVPVQDRPVRGRLFLGEPKEILENYADLVGRPGLVPDWAFGPWMSGNEWNSEARVREVVERTLAEGIPATVIVIEAWSDETTFYLFGDAEYDPVPGSDPIPLSAQRLGGRWPDPAGLVRWLHGKGLRVLLWQIPVLKDEEGHPQHSRDVAHAEEMGFCVRTETGGSYRNRAWWFPGARVLDFSNPQARTWWFAKRAYLVSELGIDGFKTDGGEHLWGSDVLTFAGERGDDAANRYPIHYQSAYHEFLRACGHQRPLTFSRAGFAGAQRFPAHWAGDEDSTWPAFRASLLAGLSAGVSGIAYWGWDLAGFSGPLSSAELYCRAVAMAAFCPIMQYHSEFNGYRHPPIDRTPWNVAEQTGDHTVLEIYREYAQLRMRLIPYLVRLGEEAARTGVPLLRAMPLEFPRDPTCWEVADQFLLGPTLLVAPVLHEGATERAVYLPQEEWHDLWSGTPVEPGWRTAPAPLHRIPVFVRGGPPVPAELTGFLEAARRGFS